MNREILSVVMLSLVANIAIGANEICHKGWIDLNKNGKMDLYENSKADIEQRIENLLSRHVLIF